MTIAIREAVIAGGPDYYLEARHGRRQANKKLAISRTSLTSFIYSLLPPPRRRTGVRYYRPIDYFPRRAAGLDERRVYPHR